jgi:hypothetical protein
MRYGNSLNLKFNVKDLITKIEVNKNKHEEDYNLAVRQYNRELEEELSEKLELLKDGKKIKPNSSLVQPVQYLSEYNRALDIFNMTTQTEIELDQQTFSQLVRDEWDWSNNFANNTVAYAGKFRGQ